MTTKQKLTFECVIEYDQDDDIQVTHLPEEIQAYLDSNYGEDNTAKVIRWRTELEEENNNKEDTNCMETFIPGFHD